MYLTLKSSRKAILAGSASIREIKPAVIEKRTIPQRSRNALPFTLSTKK